MDTVSSHRADEQAPGGAGEEPDGAIEGRLRGALGEAITSRDVVAAFALRSALSAIGNAGAVPAGPQPAGPQPGAGAAHPYVAGTVPAGAAEVARRPLTEAEVGEIVRAEAAERETAADQYDRSGYLDRAERLRREADILRSALRGERMS